MNMQVCSSHFWCDCQYIWDLSLHHNALLFLLSWIWFAWVNTCSVLHAELVSNEVNGTLSGVFLKGVRVGELKIPVGAQRICGILSNNLLIWSFGSGQKGKVHEKEKGRDKGRREGERERKVRLRISDHKLVLGSWATLSGCVSMRLIANGHLHRDS